MITKRELMKKIEELRNHMEMNNDRVISKWKDINQGKMGNDVEINELNKADFSAKYDVYSLVIRKLNEIIGQS